MTWALRNGNEKDAFKKGVGSRANRINDIIKNSNMEIFHQKDSYGLTQVLIRLHGRIAMLPSTSNSRMVSIPQKFGALKQIDFMLNNSSARTYENLLAVRNKLQNMRAMITRNPTHLEQLEALSVMYKHLTAKNKLLFDTSSKSRCALLMLLSPDMNRHDSHNIPKAVCDWLADMKIYNNDRHVDAFARRKSDCGLTTQSSDILLVRYDKATHCVDALYCDMLKAMAATSGTPTPPVQNVLI